MFMKKKSALVASLWIVLLGLAIPCKAESLSAAYRLQLTTRVLGISGPASARIAGALLGRYARLSPNQAPQFSSLARAFIRRSTGGRGAVNSSLFLIRGLANNFFKGLGSYNPQSPQFVRSLRILLATIPPSQQTPAATKQLTNLLLQINSANGGTEEDAQFLTRIVEESTDPAPVS